MTLIGRKILLTNTDESGNPTLDFPITSIECVEGAEKLVKSVNGQTGDVTITVFNENGHLVLPNGSEFWIE